MKTLAARLASLAYFQDTVLPLIDRDYIALDLATADGASQAHERFGIRAEHAGYKNLLYVHRDAGLLPREIRVELRGQENTIVLNKNALQGWLSFEGDRNLVVALGETYQMAIGATLYSGDTLVVGRRVDSWGIRVWVQGGTVCTIGDDCLLSENIQIRTTDHHSVIDLASWQQTNAPADVTIGRHVWIGANCIIVKGTNIGDGSIIASAARVSGGVPPCELWGGVPARKIRDNVSWVKSHPIPEPGEIAQLREMFPEA